MTHSTIVAGGGVAGLRAAERLAAAGFEVTVFEREPTLGGRVRSERDGPYLFDRGFQVLLTAYPAVGDVLDLDALDLRRFPPGATLCRPNHRVTVADPIRAPRTFFETAFASDLTVGDKVRIVSLRRELRRRAVDDIFTGPDQSILEYLRERGFSDRFVRRFAAPFYGGITLDRSLSTSKRIFEYTFKMLSEGYAAVPAEGMGAVTAQLADAALEAGASIETEAPVERVESTDKGVSVTVDGRTVEADAAVVATDPPTSAELTGIQSIPTTGKGCVTQYLSLPGGNPVGSQRFIMVNSIGEIPNQIAPIGVVAPEYAPDDEILLSATSLGDPQYTPDELFEQTRTTLASWYPEASFESLSLETTIRCPFAQFSQPPGVHESLPNVTDPPGRVYLAGDYTHDSSINGAIESASTAARAVVRDLQE
ncbi:MAG: FAD-dependent oxidoreductase [Halobacteriota archaeon]